MLGLARWPTRWPPILSDTRPAGRLHRHGTPYVAIALAALIAASCSTPGDIKFLAGIFAFGAMLGLTIAHLALIVFRYREPAGRIHSAYRCPSAGARSVPVPAAVGAGLAGDRG